MKKYLVVVLAVLIFLFPITLDKSLAQDSSDTSDTSTSITPPASAQAIIDKVLQDLSSVYEKFQHKKIHSRKVKARSIAILKRKLIQAVNSVPPAKCTARLKIALNDFFGLISELGQGIACGPPILPPFFDKTLPLTPDCIPPDDLRPDQFDQGFSELNPIYEQARKLATIDNDDNSVLDVCE